MGATMSEEAAGRAGAGESAARADGGRVADAAGAGSVMRADGRRRDQEVRALLEAVLKKLGEGAS